MCRNIKTLYNFEPPATDDEIQAAALQFVRKISGYHRPSRVNRDAFNLAVERITEVSQVLMSELSTKAPPKSRDAELAKARARFNRRHQEQSKDE